MFFLLACESKVEVGGPADVPPSPSIEVSGPAAIDPLFADAAYTLTPVAGNIVAVQVLDATGALVRTLDTSSSVRWNGRDDTGALVAVGDYTLHADLGTSSAILASDELDVAVVRVGVTSGALGGDRVALMWHGEDRWSDDADATTFSLAAIDVDDVVTPIPLPWDDQWEPPDELLGTNLPAAYAWNTRPTLSLVVGGEFDTTLSASIDGWTLTSGSVAPAATLVFTKDEAIATAPRVVEDTLTLSWLSGDSVIGTQDIPIRVYALLGQPTFEREGMPYQPWVAVVDPALRAIEGADATDVAVISGLVEHIYRDLGLSYDTRWGASAYTSYSGNGFDNAHFDLTTFLERGYGSVVNCTDCAAILEAFANMLGATLSYTIITPGFDLNFIQAIGSDHYSHCPFDGGGCGFNYHAVTTPDDGATIYDATLALDGDADPSSPPSDELLVQAIEGEEYLDRLVLSGRTAYRYTQKETIQ